MATCRSVRECGMSLTGQFCLVLSVCLLLLLLLWWQRRSWRLIWQLNGWRGIVQQPLLWLLLCLYLEPKSILQTICRVRKHFQRPLAMLVGNRVLMYIDDPVTMESVLSSPDCVDKSFMHEGFFARRGLLHAKGQKWRIRRKQLNPAFSHNILLSFFDTFNAVGNQLQQKFDAELLGDAVKYRDVEDLLSRAVLEVSCQTTMGTETNFTQQDGRGITRMYKKLMDVSAMRVVKPWLQCDMLLRWLKPQLYETSTRNNRRVERFVNEIVQRKHEAWRCKMNTNIDRENEQEKTSDASATSIDESAVPPKKRRIFIEQIFHLADAGELTLQNIVDESNSMVLVSFETVSNSLIIALLCLASNPECQHELRNEINCAFGTTGVGNVSSSQLQELKYLEMVVHESLRLLTTIPLSLRQVSNDLTLCVRGKRITLPRRTLVLLDTFNMQRDTENWGPHAQQFYPQHFDGSALGKRHPYAYIPFMKGVRTCIGQRYSLFLLKLFLVKLIFAFEFRTETKLEELRFVEGISLKFQNREHISFDIRKIVEKQREES